MVSGLVSGQFLVWSVVCGLWSVFIWLVVGGLVGDRFFVWSLVWSVVGAFYGRWGQWSSSDVVGGWCFAFLLVGAWPLLLRMVDGQFLFSRMVGGRCLNQYMVGGAGSWSVVGGLWLVSCQWFCTTLLRKNFAHSIS